jgi:hypothetical protein
MSTGATCPTCGASLFPTEIAEGRCTSCMTLLPGESASRAVTTDPPEARKEHQGESGPLRDDDSARPKTAEGWAGMRLGLTLVYWGVVLNLICVGPLLIPFPLLSCGAFLFVGLTVLGSLLCLVGFILYCTIPDQSGGRGWALAGLACMLATIAAVVLLVVFANSNVFTSKGWFRIAEVISALWLMAILVLTFTTSLSYTLVMRAAARYWGDRDLATSFVAYFIVLWVAPVGLFALGFGLAVSLRGSPVPPDLMVFLIGSSVLISVFMSVWFLGLLNRLRHAIPSAQA